MANAQQEGDPNVQVAASVFVSGESQTHAVSEAAGPSVPLRKEYFCGIRRWHPTCLQVFRNAKFFTFILCLYCFIEGALVSGFMPSVLSTIQKQYQFSSTLAALIFIIYEIIVSITVLLVGYFGGRSHKPRLLGTSLVIQAVGSLVFATPQFIFGAPSGRKGDNLEACLQDTHLSQSCSSANTIAYLLFLLGAGLIGIGAAPLFTIGTSYIDDIVHPTHTSVHQGIFYMQSVIGPALGFGLGSAFLSIYVNPLSATDLTTTDEDWIGAWWLCFVFSCVMSLIIAIPFFLYPRLLPDSHLVRLAREKEMAKRFKLGANQSNEVDVAAIRTMPAHLKQVVTNLSWIFVTCATSSSLIVLSGLVSFAPKYLESQFKLTAATSSIIAGGVAIPCGSAGVLTGALIIYCAKLKGKGMAFFICVVTFIVIFPSLVFLVRCQDVQLEGLTYSRSVNSSLLSSSNSSDSSHSGFTSSCNLHCNCTSVTYKPVCGDDGVTYFSACYAGCQKQYQLDPGGVRMLSLENCSCVAEQLSGMHGGSYNYNSSATVGVCDNGSCDGLVIFLVFIGVTLFLVFAIQVPIITVTVRCVAEEQRTLALGLQSTIFRIFGSIPGPLLFGAIFDSACILWQSSCGKNGNCWVYSNRDISYRALGLGIGGAFLTFFFSFLMWVVYPRHTRDEEEEEKKKDVAVKMSDVSTAVKAELEDDIEENGLGARPTRRLSTTRFDSYRSDDVLLDETESEDHRTPSVHTSDVTSGTNQLFLDGDGSSVQFDTR